MALNKDGVLLEGIRLGNANNPFNYPPRNSVTDSSVFVNQTNRSEYNIIVGSFNNSVKGADIGHPDLLFFWTKNEGAVFRFDYDSFAQKWLPSPGSIPDNIGPISNEERISVPIPDLTVSDAPIALFIGNEVRVQNFVITYVDTEANFNPNLAQGVVQIALDSGLLNFSELDTEKYKGQSVYSQRQSFFDRTKIKGLIGELPTSSATDYFIYMNPLPASGQRPRIRIDYKRHLLPVQVPDDSGLDGAVAGTFHWALSSGRIKFAASDVDDNGGRNVYYDGVHNSYTSLSIITLGSLGSSFPSAAFQSNAFIGITDTTRYLVFAELNGVRSYFPTTIYNAGDLPSRQPSSKRCYINSTTGQVYFNSRDVILFVGWTFKFVDTLIQIDAGVSVQFYRSSVNDSGLPIVDDFTILYYVEDQIVVDGIGQFPFAQLPTVPVVDDDLEYKVVQGPSSSGSFIGELVDGTESTAYGFGYLLNLDQKQIQFSNRKNSSLTLAVPTPSVKLDDAIISEFGFEVNKNGVPIVAGVDFTLDSTTGELLFLESVGGSSLNNRFGIEGTISLPSTFIANEENQFTASDVNRVILIQSGNNVGVYNIRSLIDNKSIFVEPDFISAGPVTVDIKETAEIIADNFWIPLDLELRKFTLSKGTSVNGPFKALDRSEFGVFASNGQVNLTNKASPGDVYQISYAYLQVQDDGSEEPVSVTELAAFRVRQEQATTTVGSSDITFNTDGATVDTSYVIEVYLNGVTQPPESYEFTAPSTIALAQPVQEGQVVFLNYYVSEATGGESNFVLKNSPLDVDKIRISNGQASVSINGSWGDKIFPGTVLKSAEDNEIVVVLSVNYHPSDDTTLLKFEKASNFDSGTSPFLYSSASIYPNRSVETALVSLITKNSTEMLISGDFSSVYREGTIVTLDNDPIAVNASKYDSKSNVTTITFNVRTKDNYVDPVILRSKNPVFNPGINFQTAKSANINQEFVLVQMGDTRKVLVRNVDYKVTEGGSIVLSENIGGTSVLRAIYVANDFQPAGTKFDLNYAYGISPNSSNGISGQRLTSTYNLYSPDAYFYRIETVETFLPEVQDYINNSAKSNGVSGPNTKDAVGLSNKDGGSPSPYFNEQHYYNLDYTIIQLLKFYNDVINVYEDILSNIDGRIVGGEHGRFRFDGSTNNPPRTTYASVTNDIDDEIKLYDQYHLVSFFNFEFGPVYKPMYQPNSLSRIFPVFQRANVAINDQVGFDNVGKILGTIGVENIISAGNFTSAQSAIFFDSVDSDSVSSIFSIEQNGDADNLIPPLAVGQIVTVYSNDGTSNAIGTVTSASDTSITINAPTTIPSGSIVRNISFSTDATVSRYTTGRDIGLDSETGQVKNITLPLDLSEPIKGNEILNVGFIFANGELDPRRVPALDGSSLNDYGFSSVPPLRREGEDVLFSQEAAHYALINTATVLSASLDMISTTISASIGSKFKFLDGPNAGQTRTVSAIISSGNPKVYQVSFAFFNESINGTVQKLLSDGTSITNSLTKEIGILSTNVAGTTGAVPVINSEIISATALLESIGYLVTSGSGAATSLSTFFDASASFISDGVSNLSYLYIKNGANFGLYHIINVTTSQLTIETNTSNPGTVWSSFASSSASGDYEIFNVESLLTSAGPEFLTNFINKTNDFLNSTITWSSNVSIGGIPARQSVIANRQTDITSFIDEIQTILQDSESLYDTRYLWIQQRANREDGILTQKVRAIAQRIKDIKKLEANQKKLLIMSKL